MTKHKNNTKKTVKQKSSKDTTEIVNTKCFFQKKKQQINIQKNTSNKNQTNKWKKNKKQKTANKLTQTKTENDKK